MDAEVRFPLANRLELPGMRFAACSSTTPAGEMARSMADELPSALRNWLYSLAPNTPFFQEFTYL